MIFRGEYWHIVAKCSKAKYIIYYKIRGKYGLKMKKNKKPDTEKALKHEKARNEKEHLR